MNIYINGTGQISPAAFGTADNLLDRQVDGGSKQLTCLEPDYEEFLDPALSRRMSRILKLGAAASKMCLADAGVDIPGAVIIGTGLGCVEDTETFLTSIIQNNERLLLPAPFIQSTHNSIAGQIAIMLKCNNYNSTYSHRGFSFESALLDGMMLLREQAAENVLIGGIDTLTENSFRIQERLGLFSNSHAGEGAHFFMLSTAGAENTYAKIAAVKTFTPKTGLDDIDKAIEAFLQETGLALSDIDLILTGHDINQKEDKIYQYLRKKLFNDHRLACFKHLSGEHMTSVAFAVSLSAGILKHRKVPANIVYSSSTDKRVNNILIYNHYQNLNHSMILLSLDDAGNLTSEGPALI